MDLNYNIDYDIASFLLLLIEVVFLRIRCARDKTYDNKLYIMLMHSAFALSIAGVLTTLLRSVSPAVNVPVFLRYIVSYMSYLFNAMIGLIFYKYVCGCVGGIKEKTVAYYISTYFPFFFIIECLIGNCFVNLFISFGKYGHYSYGCLIWVTYIYPVYYLALAVYRIIRNRSRADMGLRISVMYFSLSTIIAIGFRLVDDGRDYQIFAIATSLMVMLLTTELPDYKKLKKTTKVLETIRTESDINEEQNRTLISEMSHEICVPIEKIIEKCESVKDKNTVLTEDETEYIANYGKFTRFLVNNVMGLIQIGENPDYFSDEEYYIKNMAEDVIKIMAPAAADKNDEILLNIADTIPEKCYGAANVIKQIMLNLVFDGIKYTKAGKVTMNIDYREIDGEDINLVISVEDTGIGMRRDMVKKLRHFDPNDRRWKNNAFSDGNFKLKMTKYLVEKMKGHLIISSEVGAGSKITAVFAQKKI